MTPVVLGQGGVNNAELNGNYAFTSTGINGNGNVASVYEAVGRFTADGAGNLTNGGVDFNGVGVGATVAAQAFTGTYSIGADHRGVMTLNIGGSTARLAFAMTAGGNAKLIKFDAAGGAGTIGSGSIEKANTTAFSTARITGDYVLGGAGFDNTNNRASIMTRFTANGSGVLSNAAGDVNAYGTNYQMVFTAANYAVTDAATGHSTMRFAFTFGGVADTIEFCVLCGEFRKAVFDGERRGFDCDAAAEWCDGAAAGSYGRFCQGLVERKYRDLSDGTFSVRQPGGSAESSCGLTYDEWQRRALADVWQSWQRLLVWPKTMPQTEATASFDRILRASTRSLEQRPNRKLHSGSKSAS